MNRLPALLLLFGAAVTAAAQPISPGDIVVTGRRTADNHGVIAVFRGDGTFVRTLRDTPLHDWDDAAFNRAGLLHAGSGDVFIFDTSGSPAGSLPREGLSFASAITFAADGRTFVLWDPRQLVIYAPDRTRLASHTLPGDVTSIDLAADQCTLYFTASAVPPAFHRGVVGRVNVCGSTFAPESVRSYPGVSDVSAQDVRVLPTGQLLVARGAAGVELLDASGSLLRTYATPATELAIAPGGAEFLAAYGSIRRVSLATGAVTHTFVPGINVRGLAVAGDPRAAFVAGDIPLLGERALVLLGALLAWCAVAALRRA